MNDRKRLWRIMQKPPVAYEIGILLIAMYAVVFTASPSFGFAFLGASFLLAGWWFLERGASYNKRLTTRNERIRQLEDN